MEKEKVNLEDLALTEEELENAKRKAEEKLVKEIVTSCRSLPFY